MLKGKTIYLRMLEPEDYELTYQWHNDIELQKFTMGPIFVASKTIEKQWALSKASNNTQDIYFAICLIENDKMIGFSSINNIDYKNRICSGGVVIGDRDYKDGIAMIESHLLKLKYIFDQLNIHRYETSCLEEHVMAKSSIEAFMFTFEGKTRDKIYKNGRYHNVLNFSILDEEYYENLKDGLYDKNKVLKRVVQQVKTNNKNLK